MTKLILLIGLPGSGKSSLAQQIVARKGCYPIATDAIRAQLFGHSLVQGPWLEVQQEVQRQFQQAVEQISTGASPAAIYDATNATRVSRQEAIALARASGFTHIIGLWVDTPVEVCLERNKKRDRVVPEEVIFRMYASLTEAPPSLEDGLDDLSHFTTDCHTLALI